MLRKDLKVGDIFQYSNGSICLWIVAPNDSPTIVRASNGKEYCASTPRSSKSNQQKEVILIEHSCLVAPAAPPAQLADAIDPPHYKNLTPEPIVVIEGWGLDYNLASVVAYIARAGRKEPGVAGLIKDLKKARRFLNRAINLADGKADWLYRE